MIITKKQDCSPRNLEATVYEQRISLLKLTREITDPAWDLQSASKREGPPKVELTQDVLSLVAS